jgi:hypothetical protein
VVSRQQSRPHGKRPVPGALTRPNNLVVIANPTSDYQRKVIRREAEG